MLSRLNKSIILFVLIALHISGCGSAKQPPAPQIKDDDKNDVDVFETEKLKLDSFMQREFSFKQKQETKKRRDYKKDIYYLILKQQGIIK